MEVEALRLLIREKLQDGRLSHEQISRVQSRPADGQKCDACEKLITTAQFVVTGTTLAGRGPFSCTSNASSSGMTRGARGSRRLHRTLLALLLKLRMSRGLLCRIAVSLRAPLVTASAVEA